VATRQTMTISPPQMIKEVDKLRRKEGRTRSELMREALRFYARRIEALPVYNPQRERSEKWKKAARR
jgi:metal-responsive CopG/Arc/MetJ family transcriptional regulator